jgi:hypothetical protein
VYSEKPNQRSISRNSSLGKPSMGTWSEVFSEGVSIDSLKRPNKVCPEELYTHSMANGEGYYPTLNAFVSPASRLQ